MLSQTIRALAGDPGTARAAFGRWTCRGEEGFLGIFLRPHEVHAIGDIGSEGFWIVS